jgi:putative tricarboxylic transport membrane protein
MSTLNVRSCMAASMTGALAVLVSFAALAQSYPARPIELISHTSAGSGTDVVARALADVVRRENLLPQQFVVVNRVGGAGVIAYTFFKTKRGDPYYMLTVSPTLLAMAHRPDVNIGLEHYTPLALFAIDPQTIMVPADSPFATFKELVAAAQKQPDSLVAATTSVQGTGRLVLYLIEKAAPGAKFKFVTFKGGSEAATSVAGGHTHFTTENLSEGLGLLEAKKLRVLGVAADRRLPQIPDVPTLKELGYAVEAGTTRGFAFPAGVPKEAVTVMETALERAHKTQAWKEHAARNMYLDVYMNGADFGRFLATRLAEVRGFYDAVGLGAKP